MRDTEEDREITPRGTSSETDTPEAEAKAPERTTARAVVVRRARAGEAAALSALAIRSKAHWGYTPEQMDLFRAGLTLSERDLVEHEVHVIVEDGALAAFCTLRFAGEAGRAVLDDLFVDPDHMRRGLGAVLYRHACELARARGISRLELESDPNAAGFYAAQGARLEREIPSRIPGRSLPVFTISLAPEGELRRATRRSC